LTFNAGGGLFVILPWTAPVLMEMGLIWPGKVIYFIYNFFCHQLLERTWLLTRKGTIPFAAAVDHRHPLWTGHGEFSWSIIDKKFFPR
jgi:hypothetical protein